MPNNELPDIDDSFRFVAYVQVEGKYIISNFWLARELVMDGEAQRTL